MKLTTATLVFLMLFALVARSQSVIKGSVYDGPSGSKMPNVFITDLTNKQISLSDKKGDFVIKAAPGHLLVFTAPTYANDTVYITDMKNLKVRLTSTGINLNEVSVAGKRAVFDPKVDYRQIYEKSAVRPLSPSTWFSREGRNARRLKKFFKWEVEQREIDQSFNKTVVSKVVPLKGEELDDFMSMYRPTYKFVKENNEQSIMIYVNDSYKKFMALPPEKRKMQPLDTLAN